MIHLLAWTNSTTRGEFLVQELQVLAVFFAIAVLAGMWKMFEKADRPGWAAIIPFYNLWVMAEMVGWPGRYGLFPLLLIPLLSIFTTMTLIQLLWISAMLAVWVTLMIKLANAFGEGAIMTVALILFAPVGWVVLGFGDAVYQRADL